MKTWISVPVALLGGALFVGCSAADDGYRSPAPGPEQSAGRREPLGKADSLSGSCLFKGEKLCGKKSKGKCWCDAACSVMGDCCADASNVCGIGGGGPTKCERNTDCASGEYCHSPDGCATPGTCEPVPSIFCAALAVEYCTCDGETKSASAGCIFDRFDHIGACKPAGEFCGGIAAIQCPSGKVCIDDPSDSCDPNNGGADCGGVCVAQPEFCGGIANIQCPTGKICVDDPNDGCDVNNGGADCGGICVDEEPKPKTCGGIAGIQCPAGQTCIDDPDDSCDPNNGGADCGGVCVDGPVCPPLTCKMACQYGMAQDKNGCNICQCNPPPAQNTCEGRCGGSSADKSCWCDSLCTGYGDCCGDYKAFCGPRTPASGQCVKNSNDTCTTDADCTSGGCGGELCFNPAFGSGISTCECTTPQNVAGCGCVAGKCTWYN